MKESALKLLYFVQLVLLLNQTNQKYHHSKHFHLHPESGNRLLQEKLYFHRNLNCLPEYHLPLLEFQEHRLLKDFPDSFLEFGQQFHHLQQKNHFQFQHSEFLRLSAVQIHSVFYTLRQRLKVLHQRQRLQLFLQNRHLFLNLLRYSLLNFQKAF